MVASFNIEPTTRFAPSPTGPLHLGHAYAALVAAERARANGGVFHVRIENIDHGRCRRQFEDMIFEDLTWLGLTWEKPVMRQSERIEAYERALAQLQDRDLLYPCFCTRKDIREEIEHAVAAPHGPDGPLYPGTCRSLTKAVCEERIARGESFALRLRMDDAIALAGPLCWQDETAGEVLCDPAIFGDIVLARKDSPTSYHLAVVIDDQEQGITLVTRGDDLFPSTHVHRLLQALFSLNTPTYLHHKLIVGADGKRLSKRDEALTLRAMRESGKTPTDIFKAVGLTPAT